MNKKIDRSLTVSWCLELSDGTKLFDLKDSKQWLKTKDFVESNKIKIKTLHLFGICNLIDDTNFNGAHAPEHCEGYFFSNKILASFSGDVEHLFVLGWIEKGELVKLTYNSGMTCTIREHYPIKDDDPFLIRNNQNA